MTAMPHLKIMYLNPVGIDDYDALFADMARDCKLPGTEVHVTSLPASEGRFSHIEYRTYEAVVTRGIVRATRAASREGFDAFAIGCFYDTALHDAREISGEMFVTAPCLAACEIAASLSNRFGIIGPHHKCVDQMSTVVHHHGFGRQLSGFYPIELATSEFRDDQSSTTDLLIEAGRRAVEEDYAEALILACTLELGCHKLVEEALHVPVIDPSTAVLKRAEYGALLKHTCGWIPSRKWSCKPPPEEELASLGLFEGEEAFGNRVIVEAD